MAARARSYFRGSLHCGFRFGRPWRAFGPSLYLPVRILCLVSLFVVVCGNLQVYSLAADHSPEDAAAEHTHPSPRIPECGLASVYSALNELGMHVSLSNLRGQFQQVHRDTDLSSLSFKELIEVLGCNGVSAKAVQFASPNIDNITVPAILHINSIARSNILGTGHFVLLSSVEDRSATIIDLTAVREGREDGVFRVHKGRLRNYWKGDAILLSSTNTRNSQIFSNRNLTISAIVLIAASFWIATKPLPKKHVFSAKRRAGAASLSLMPLLTCLLLPGCGGETSGGPTASAQPLVFERQHHDFGVVETGGSVKHRFTLRVWDQGPVRIDHIGSTCCGKLPLNPNLTGETLEPGSTHSFDVTFGRQHVGQHAHIAIDIETTPKSAEPIILTVSGMLLRAVHAHPVPLVIHQNTKGVASAILRLSRLRTSQIKQLQLDQEKSALDGLKIVKVDAKSVRVGHPESKVPPFVDTVNIELSTALPLADGRHDLECQLFWKNEGLTPTKVPVIVFVSHPYRPVVDRIYCGELRPNSVWEHRIRMVRQDGSPNVRVKSISSNVNWVTAVADTSTDSILVRVTPTGERGKFESILTFSYSDPAIPSFNTVVTGIVLDN